jgi:SOS-response transcriptional repressor LexA
MSSQDDPKPVAFIRHPIYPNATPMAWTVSGDSMDKSVPDGSVAFGVDFKETSGTPLNGDMVVVEHILDGRVERTIKRVKLTDAGIELHPESTNPKWRPIVLKSIRKNDSEIRIRSLIHRTDTDQNRRG